MLASPGLLTSWEAAAAVSESAERGVPLLILAPPDLVIDQLTQGAAAGSGSPQRTRCVFGEGRCAASQVLCVLAYLPCAFFVINTQAPRTSSVPRQVL
jgi:hypothetical protein